MNIFYLLSVIGSRFITLATLLILSYLMNSHDFGVYSLVATNGLLVHILLGSCLIANLWRDVSSLEPASQAGAIAGAVHYAQIIGCCLIVSGIVLFLVLNPGDRFLAVVPLLAALILGLELALIVLNARRKDVSFTLVSFTRGALTLALALVLIAAGAGIWGALAAQILGVALTLLLVPSVRAIFVQGYRTERSPARPLLAFVKFGAVSALSMNVYMLVNAAGRNLIALSSDPIQAGIFSLAGDLFFAPLALFGTSLSLSSIPTLYQASASQTESASSHDDRASVVSSAYMMANFAVCVPYALGGFIVAPALARLMPGAEMASGVASIASFAAIQGACIVLISAQAALAMTKGLLKQSLFLSLASVVLVMIALLSSADGLVVKAQAATVALVLVAATSVILMPQLTGVRLCWRELWKVIASSLSMLVPLWVFDKEFGDLAAILLALPTAAFCFFGVGMLLKSSAILGLLQFRSGGYGKGVGP